LEDILLKIKGIKAKAGSSEIFKRTLPKPNGLNTVAFLEKAVDKMGISSSEIMKIAQDLYESGYISYPRTESTMYADDFEFDDVLEELT